MSEDRWLMPAAEIAQALGRSRDWFYDHRKELEAKGMPAPHPAFLPALMYPKGPMRRWIDDTRSDEWVGGRHEPEREQEDASARMAARAEQLARGMAAG